MKTAHTHTPGPRLHEAHYTAPEKLRLLRKYRANEDRNYHSENLLLLAEAFGTQEEVTAATRQVAEQSTDRWGYRMPYYLAHHINSYYHQRLLK